MALLDWNNNYSVNIQEIDSQHKILVGLINNLHDGMRVGKGKEAIGGVLSELVNYTEFHFSHEEKLFSMHGYPESSTHKMLHYSLIKQVKELKNNYDNGNKVLSMEVMDFLKNWLSDHIVGTDKKYTTFLNSKGIK